MKKFNYNGNIFYVCIVAILCYTFLNGHQIALEMQQKERFENLSRVVGGISRLTGGEFLSRQLTATVAHIANYDITVAEHIAVQVAEEPESPSALASNMPETTPAIQENTASDTADSPAPPTVAQAPTARPTNAEPVAMQTTQGSQLPSTFNFKPNKTIASRKSCRRDCRKSCRKNYHRSYSRNFCSSPLSHICRTSWQTPK